MHSTKTTHTLHHKKGWQNWKLSHAFNLIGSGTTPPTGSSEYFQGNIPWVNTGDLNDGDVYSVNKFVSEKAVSSFSALKIFPKDSLVIALYGATIGKLGILRLDACTNQACCVLAEPIHLDTKFSFYWLMSQRNNIIELAQGGGQPNISQEVVKNLRVLAPSIKRQRLIAHFLDRKTAAIATLIAKKQRLIQLLEEKRTALINQAVTKGLNSDAPMKDSQVPWLGNIPRHWNIVRIKHLLSEIIDAEHKTPTFYPDGEFLVARTSNVRQGQLVENDAKYTNSDEFIEWTRRGKPKPGDVLFTREAPPGEACIVPEQPLLCLGQRMVLFRVKQKVLDEEFVVNSLYAGLANEFIESLSQGSTVAHLNMSDIVNIPILTPPIKEQKLIAIHLRKEISRINFLMKKTVSSITKLEEYRQSLITAAVTGKLTIEKEHTA